MVGSGYCLTLAAGQAMERYDIGGAAIGSLGTGVVTSLPELVTTIAAVRRGAISLAIGGIMGGNAFDVLFLASADSVYTEGSIYHHVDQTIWFQLALTCTMVGIILLGLSLRQKRGPGNIGFEGALVILCYLIGASVIVLGG